jgi:hypothetical protein
MENLLHKILLAIFLLFAFSMMGVMGWYVWSVFKSFL